ncbi:hypothetical protein JX265_010847 [Neoarthrinium moseri]|uniref:Cytochrome P450 n=1 Tax=Neoarthrinium moseri TaxID=1658444 RepID=A0A9P9WDJ1_9PEZI|nr:uncharacterized protein JN550_010587 [Neoarthrinium moseri]KAI1841843.1 hypothetical protein JX266_011921 [Neoarthrinium moseri]KAI1858179.1 hypothetical protein JX265_010847 [Neoarthrinium moseri]KAI1861956.1 hypothetical protein JN550_010587 [Neoarthrinium moseri]
MTSAVGTIHFPGKSVYVIHPEKFGGTKAFAKTRERSLMAGFWLAYDKAIGLSPGSKHWMCLPDDDEFRKALVKVFKAQFLDLGLLKHYSAGVDERVGKYWDERFTDGAPLKLNLGAWIYDDLLRAFSSLFWDEEGPFQDRELREQTSIFLGNLHNLMAPMEFLNSSQARRARAFVRQKLDTGHVDSEKSPDKTTSNGKGEEASKPAGLLAAIRQHLFQWDAYEPHAWVDYQISVVAVVLSNIVTAIQWTLLYILSRPELKAQIITEIRTLVEHCDGVEGSTGSPVIDAAKIREYCPHLLATWYEMLRMNGAVPVARYITDNAVFMSKYELKKGSIMVSPMAVRHFNPDIWGPEPESFHPERMIKDGQVNTDMTRQLGTFGIPGVGICPGRYLAFNVAMSMLVKMLVSFDIDCPEGGMLAQGIVPKPKGHMSLGMSEPEQDPEVLLSRRAGAASVKFDFTNIKPGW